ncbi:MAG TPA: hypothetical protein VK572_05770 [Burkholderiales bacterium]|nr:hypothetical protein [Burkholderiales bacterium]
MRKAKLAALLLLVAFAAPARALFWSIETVDHPSNAAVGQESSIILDSAGRPHIGYRDTINESVKYARKNANGTWTIEIVDSPGFAGTGVSLALDPSGAPHLTYYSGRSITSTGDVRYASRSCWFFGIFCSWSKETIAAGVFSTSQAGNTSLGFDASGNPNVSYFDHTARQLKWARKIGGSWSIANVVATSGGSVSQALDSDGFPHLVFSGSSGTVNYVRIICVFILCGWNLNPVDSGLAGTLRLDANGQPHLSYAQGANIRYAVGACPASNPCTWTTELVGSAGQPLRPSLALDACTTPHIAFLRQRGTGVADLVYAKRAGAWNLETADLDASSTVVVSITLDAGNNPHISYQGFTGQPLKHASGSGHALTSSRRLPEAAPKAATSEDAPKPRPRKRSELAPPTMAAGPAAACGAPRT